MQEAGERARRLGESPNLGGRLQGDPRAALRPGRAEQPDGARETALHQASRQNKMLPI